MTSKGRITQYNGTPNKYCHTSTDTPNVAPRDGSRPA
jgi:hypothetical protein